MPCGRDSSADCNNWKKKLSVLRLLYWRTQGTVKSIRKWNKLAKEEKKNGGRKAAVRPIKGQRGENEAQTTTTTKANRRGYNIAINTGGKILLKKTRLWETNRGKPERKSREMRFRKACHISFNSISEATKVYDPYFYRWLHGVVAFLESIYIRVRWLLNLGNQ